jgi:hypothetical protein
MSIPILYNHFDIYRIHAFIKEKSDDKYFTDEMNQYGCWCGQTGSGNPVDDLDRYTINKFDCLFGFNLSMYQK